MYISPALRHRLRPFMPVLLPLYRSWNKARNAFQTHMYERAQRREEAEYPANILALVQGLRRAPEQYAADVAAHPDIPSALSNIAALVCAEHGGDAHLQLDADELKKALCLLRWWAADPECLEALIHTAPAMPRAQFNMLQRIQWFYMLKAAFSTALRGYDVLSAKAISDIAQPKLGARLASAIDLRLPLQIARSFVPDRAATSLDWMDAFPTSEHQGMRRALVQSLQDNSPDRLRTLPLEYLERVILNPVNLTDDLNGRYYQFLELVKATLLEEIDRSSSKRTQHVQALIERKMMRRDILRGDYVAALKRARRLCRFPNVLPEDRYVRVDLLNKLGRTALVQRYVGWLQSVHAREAAPASDIALHLWAAWCPNSALEVLGEPENWSKNEQAAKVALRSLIRLRRFGEAADLARKASRWRALSGQLTQAASTQRALKTTGLSIPAGEDAALHVMEHWLEQHQRSPALAYTPEPRRVLIYSHSLGIGGAERQVTNLVSALCEDPEASSVHLLLKERPKNAYNMSQDAARFTTHDFASLPHELPSLWHDHPLFQEVLALARPLGMSGISQVLRAIYTIRPEVVHVRGGLHAEIVLGAVLAGVPKVVVHFGSMTRGQQSSGTELEMLREKLVERAMELCAAYPQVVLAANSRAAANDWARASNLPKSRMDVLYNAVDARELGYSAPPPFDAGIDRALVVGSVFRFAPVKDPMLWIETARLVHEALPGTKFLMIGDGPMRKSVERAIESARLTEQFELPGLITKGLFPYLRRMDLSLMTTRTESLPNAVIEAQLAGLPVVAPDVGGMAEAIADSDTARLPERSAPALAAAVVAGLQDIEWRRDVYERAPELILEKFSRKRQLDSTKAVYGWSQ